ncbi:MAG TPA: TIGR03619 family F420-dependent LLM class oxidoreductase [Solirubrobacter sp.]|nr:TIGR03619 family F420-dependent LLM class oxidoreductase [Solirubrobacter sp.]
MRIGAKLPNSGPLPFEVGIPAMARALEEAGFDSLWVSDHIVMPREIRSRYPFAADGKATWSTDMPWFDAIVALAAAAAVTEHVRLGTAVLVLPLRHPVEFAKQAASIDAVSGGRLELGVGAGWLEEEFDALGVPFHERGRRLDESIAIARGLWTGERGDVLAYPTPAHRIPVLIGGHSAAALRRAARYDGWLAQQSAGALDPAALAGKAPRIVLRIVQSLGRPELVAEKLRELADAGVDEVIVDVDPADAARAHAVLREAA